MVKSIAGVCSLCAPLLVAHALKKGSPSGTVKYEPSVATLQPHRSAQVRASGHPVGHAAGSALTLTTGARESMARRTILINVILVLVTLFSTAQISAAQISAQPAQTKKYVIFRDDDVAPKPGRDIETLEAVNQVHIDENVPVTLAIIPHPAAQGNDAQLFPGGTPVLFGPSFPGILVNELLQEPAFYNYMRSIATNPLFEFAQHGYTHINDGLTGPSNTSEFAGEPFDVQYDAIRQGRNDIADAFGITPTTFVPPYDHGDLTTLEALRALGFTEYCTSAGDFAALQGRESGIRVEAATINIGGANYTALNESVQLAKNETDQFFSDPNNSTLIVAYHYWTFNGPGGLVDTRKVQLLRGYIDYVKTKEGVQFTTLNRQVTVSTGAAPGAASTLMEVSGALTPYRLWLVGGVGVVYLLGFAWFVVSRTGGRKD
jgi:peptidoglycan/xylan/chitin deacetylase (PgdA/CDA1 family)